MPSLSEPGISEGGEPRRVAIVTGGSNGIGATIVRQLAARGMRVVNLDRAPQPDGMPAEFHQVDLLDESATRAALASCSCGSRCACGSSAG